MAAKRKVSAMLSKDAPPPKTSSTPSTITTTAELGTANNSAPTTTTKTPSATPSPVSSSSLAGGAPASSTTTNTKPLTSSANNEALIPQNKESNSFGVGSMASSTTPDPFSGLIKDADKLKLMLLAWNYQNSNAIRNGGEGPDLGMMNGLWTQYQNALSNKEKSASPFHMEQNSPMEQEETNSSGQKEDDDGSEDESDDKIEPAAHDPERLKAFNMFVRLFVDENLDRMIPISKQPKEKIQAIIDSCTRQFPEFADRSRKRIRTYLKSCRRNKKTKDGWDNTPRPTPAHLTSAQAEQILAVACENESMNAKRMRLGLEPISHSFFASPSSSQNNSTLDLNINSSLSENKRTDNNSSPLPTTKNHSRSPALGSNTQIPSIGTTNGTSLYDYHNNSSEFTLTRGYQGYFNNSVLSNSPTDLSMKPPPSQEADSIPQSNISSLYQPPPPVKLPLLSHKLSTNEMNAVRQLVTGYRESAAFLLRSADELEQLLIQQQP